MLNYDFLGDSKSREEGLDYVDAFVFLERGAFFRVVDVMDAEMWMKRLPGHEASTLMLSGCPPRLDSVSKPGVSELFQPQ